MSAKQKLVIDNTNPTVEDRKKYIIPAKEKGFQILAYYFNSSLSDCKKRNSQREGKKVIPLVGILSTYKKLVLPSYTEGFDAIYSVKTCHNYSFIVEEWNREI